MIVTAMRDRLTRRRPDRPAVYQRHQFAAVVAFVLFLALVVPRLATTPVAKNLVNLWLVYGIAAIGFFWMFGLAGRFAFCQTFMMLLGGYTSAWVTRGDGRLPVVLGLLCGVAVTAAVAVAIGLAVHRASDLYFAIATLAVTQVGAVVFRRWEGFSGQDGTTVGIEPLSIFGREFLADAEVFRFLVPIVGLVLAASVLIERSPLRRDAIAARDLRAVAETSGVPAVRAQITMFALGSAMGGLSGALIGHWGGIIAADSFGVNLAIGLFLMVILGGSGSPWGALVGAAFYVWVPEVLTSFTSWRQVVYGSLLLVTIILLPDGIVGIVGSGRGVARRWFGVRGRVAAATAGAARGDIESTGGT